MAGLLDKTDDVATNRSPSPFALSVSKGRSSFAALDREERCFDKLSTNGGEVCVSFARHERKDEARHA